MTYCFAWKQNGCVFMVGDSLMSKDSKVDSNLSSIGERHGKYGEYYVEESTSKIFRIQDVLISFAGGSTYAQDIIEQFEVSLAFLSLEEILQNICNSSSDTADFEILVAKKVEGTNQLYYANSSTYELIDHFKSIGSGTYIDNLNSTLLNFTRGFEFEKDSAQVIISKMVVFLQIIVYKNGYLNYGVGGTVCGACLDETVLWNDDLFYMFYQRDFEKRITLNVSVRDDVLLTGSGYNDTTKVFATLAKNKGSSIKGNLIRKLIKVISTIQARFVIFYSKDYNCIYFCDTLGESITNIAYRYVKRGTKTKIAFIVHPELARVLCSRVSSEQINIPVFYIASIKLPYKPREVILKNVYNIEDVTDGDDVYDFDLRQIEIQLPDSLRIDVRDATDYDNVIIVDFDYLVAKIKERLEHYEGIDVDLSGKDIIRGLTRYVNMVVEEDSRTKVLVFYANNSDYTIDGGVNIFTDFVSATPCGSFYGFSKTDYRRGVVANTSQFLREYYVNENYYGINKIIIVMDNSPVNQILELLPFSNRNSEEVDVILIRNHNSETNIVVPTFYWVVDIIIDEIFHITPEHAMLWDSYRETEHETAVRNEINEALRLR